MPAQLGEWGCDAALWDAIHSKQAMEPTCILTLGLALTLALALALALALILALAPAL